ncbi:MAG: ABC transporter ATP-binding protein [Nitriliruptorales bacterium]|nr:ABC transporter ATP-binding protein [Nitriliruptorales bacterium]
MADDNTNDDVEVVEDIEWRVDDDGTEYFVDDGWRYELGEDGYAYPVDQVSETGEAATDEPPTATSEEAADQGAEDAGDEPSPFSPEGEAAADERTGSAEADRDTSEIPQAKIQQRAEEHEPSGAPSSDGLLLSVQGIRSGYGSLPVLHGVDIEIRAGETAVMFGLNGAGKTTTAKNICGVLPTWEGAITFEGEDITSWKTQRCVDAGIVMVPEGRRVFPELSVKKNLQIGAWSQRKDSSWFDDALARVYDYFPRLGEREGQLAGTLSGGEQQMLAIGRGLMANPRLLIIDEASMGLAPVIVHDVFEIVGQISDDGTTVLMIEQNVSALEVADAAFVMEQGRIIKRLRGEQLDNPDEVSEVLMG